jgi:L-asparaginase
MNKERKILVIYTGGTIGMIQDAATGLLAPFDFSRLEKQIPELNRLSAEVHAVSFETPIDSSNMGIAHWRKMAEIIKENYDSFDGFVILHGSDTMSYTASALSFMLENLAKPVILTGSQLPIGVVRTDGKENIITAIEIAADYENGLPVVPEVAIYFEYHLYRGNRTYKYNAEHFEAFRSPNYPVLASAGVHIQYNKNFINTPAEGKFGIDTRMENNITVLTLFPGISQHIIDAASSIKNNKVLIIRTFGSGNAMTDPQFLRAMERTMQHGVTLVNVSQCRAGGVTQGKYQTSAALQKMGVTPAGDMMIEAAITKSMHLLGKGYQGEEFSRYFTTDLRGELTTPSPETTA